MSQSSASLIDYQIGPDSYVSVQSALAKIQGKSRIINGACEVQQRPSIAVTAGVFGYGGPDRFSAQNGGSAGGQFTQSAGTLTWQGVVRPCVVQTVNTAVTSLTGGNFWSGIDTRLEGINVFDLMGQQMTFSFVFEASIAGTYVARVQLVSSTPYAYLSQFVYTTPGTPQLFTVTTSALPSAAAIVANANAGMELGIGCLNNGTFVAPSANTWTAGTLNSVAGSTNWGATVGNFIAATLIKIEAGPIATAYEFEDFIITYLRCLRYYIAGICLQGTLYISTGAGISANLPVPMRAVPTIGGFSNLNIFGGGAPNSPGVVNTNGTTTTVAAAQIDWASSSGSVGMTLFGTCTLNSEL